MSSNGCDNLKKAGSFGTFLILLFVAISIKGSNSVGIHPDCTDGQDNDGDGSIDHHDDDCFAYPYADGNGESFTEPQDRRTGDNYLSGNAYTYWNNYWLDNGFGWDFAICPTLGAPPTGWDAIYQQESHNLELQYISNNCPP